MSIAWMLVGLCSLQTPAPSATTPPKPAGYVISDGMIQSIAKRMAFEMGAELNLDSAQEQAVAEALQREWTPFIHKNHDQLAPLFEGWIQAFVNPQAPSDEDVKKWAEAALDLQTEFIAQMDHSDQEVAKLLRPDQRARFKTEVAKVRAGFSAFTLELNKWRNGNVDRGYWNWQQERRERRREKKFGTDAVAQAQPGASRSKQMLDEWDAYVLEVSMRFDFDAGQKSSAYGILADIKDRAKAYVSTHRADVELALAGTPGDTTGPQAPPADDVLAPINTLFDELVQRIDALPTEKQRAAATQPAAP